MDPSQLHSTINDPRYKEGLEVQSPETPEDSPTSDLSSVTDSIVDDMVEAQKLVKVMVSPRGRIRRNGPCPCRSGKKLKKCCLPKVNAGELPHIDVRGVRPPIPTQKIPPTAKLRYLLRKALKERKDNGE